jgi:hypothetical protein
LLEQSGVWVVAPEFGCGAVGAALNRGRTQRHLAAREGGAPVSVKVQVNCKIQIHPSSLIRDEPLHIYYPQ